MKKTNLLKKMKPYAFTFILIVAIILGGCVGHVLGPRASSLKPLGDIFINLLFAAVVPLVFFSIASAVAHLGQTAKLMRILTAMFAVFALTGVIAAVYMIVVVTVFPPGYGVVLNVGLPQKVATIDLATQMVTIFTVSDFNQLLSHHNMLPLIFFSLLIGLATAATKEKGKAFAMFLKAGAEVMMQVIYYIMFYAPIGFFAYFAVLAGELGPQLMANYFRVFMLYYSAALIYFVFAFTAYAFLAGGKKSVKLFWSHVWVPMMTALATCSSAASIPANLQATKEMKVTTDVYETVIPMGAILHKDGSVLGAILKIAFLFGVYGMSFSGPTVLLTALMIALLVGTVMGAIPSGGMLGEMLILSLYGFPPQALLMIAAISLIIDPLATMLNVTGDSVCSMIVDRVTAVRAYSPNE